MTEREPCQLYLITPEVIDDISAFASELDGVLATGAVACVQLRLKGGDDDTVRAAATALLPVCHKHDVPLLLNDRADLAAEVGADGVHIGQQDDDIATARSLLGADKDIGVTCHDSKHLAFEAGEAGANYVAFGACFPGVTKPDATPVDLSVITAWDEITDIPCVAIGGITHENCKAVADAGAHFIAVSSAVWNYPEGPAASVKAFAEILGSE